MASHQKPKRKIILLDGTSDHYEELSEVLLADALNDPDVRQLFETMAASEEIGRRELMATAFAFGVSSAVDAMREGKIKTFPRE